jgi:L-fuculose-phosphate aldolase
LEKVCLIRKDTEVSGKKELKKLRRRIINATKRLYLRGICSGVGGNISLRTDDPNIILVSPSGIPISDMSEDDLCLVDISKCEKDQFKILKGDNKYTSEIYLHSRIFYRRSNIKAVLHTHPPMVTAYACTNKKINFDIAEDKNWYIGDVEYLPFVASSSKDLCEAAWPKLEKNYALILKNHGMVALGDTLLEAVNITELLEELAKISYYAQNIGDTVEIPKEYWEDRKIIPRNNLIYNDCVFD